MEVEAKNSLTDRKEEEGVSSGMLAGGAAAAFALGVIVVVLIGLFTDAFNRTPPAEGGDGTTGACFPPGATEASCPYDFVNNLNGDSTATLSGTPYPKPLPGVVSAPRIEYEVITVDNLTLSVEFWTKVLGATTVDFCEDAATPGCESGYVSFSGDVHMEALFEWEMANGQDGMLPDIGSAGDYEVRSVFVVLGNGVVQLMQFAKKVDGAFYDLREDKTSPCWVGGAHIDFWIADSLDMNVYIEAAEKEALARGMDRIDWNRPVPQDTRADKWNVPKEKYANKVVGGEFGGLEWSYFKGPVGEQLELYKVTGTLKESFGRHYCDRGAVISAFQADSGEATDKPITQQMLGMFQFGYRTANLERATAFYTEVLGGTLMTYPTHGLNIRGEEAHWMILAKETLDAYEYADANGIDRAQALIDFGVANISSSGGNRLDHRFILFDNFVVEPLQYTDGLAFGGERFNPMWNNSVSPANLGNVGAAWEVKTADGSTELTPAMAELRARAATMGFPNIDLPTKPASFEDAHAYAGFEYGYGKGESGEVLIFTKIAGKFEEALHKAMQKAGAVTTRFDDLNIFKNGGMKAFCDSVRR